MSRKLVVGNWKMNPPTIVEAVTLARLVTAIDAGSVDVGVAPPATALAAVAEAVRGTSVQVFAQDVHWQASGAYTGQISAPMLAGIAGGSIVGHSEVRRDQGDDDARVAAKATAALRHDLFVIYCIGETLEQRGRGETDGVIERQIRNGLGTIDKDLLVVDGTYRFAIAYEPIWAIGTGVVATPAQASEAIGKIREELMRLGFGGKASTILYGGSVSAANCRDCAGAEGVDGALVGGASLKAEEFAAIVAAFR
ncbi:MAG TPA: triose-phosphate isomerase [Candidatus Limnocylindria bacterium]